MNINDKEQVKELLRNNKIIEFDEKTLVLASNSASRFKIMENAGLNFAAIPSLVDEEKLKNDFGKVKNREDAIEYVKLLSYEKALWLSRRLKNAIILAADTVAFYNDEVLEKPKDEKDARRIFSLLSDSIHFAITGVCMVDGDNIDNFVKISPVRMLEIPEDLQDILIKDKLTYTYAGGYCIDGNLGDKAIVSKEDFNNVMGLPIEEIIKKLKETGYDFSK